MRNFNDDDFLLNTDTARDLYHNHAALMPIFDYHSHLSAEEIYKDLAYKHISDAWLQFDHYKWRAMRTMGFDESLVTGDESKDKRFAAYALTVQNCIGSPLYHWTHMELKKYFGFNEPLGANNIRKCLDQCNRVLTQEGLTVRKIISQSNVALIGTTDDPIDDLEYHKLIKEDDSIEVKVIPTFRPDVGLAIDKETFTGWIKSLEAVTHKIASFADLIKALRARIDFFASRGCVSADHGMDYVPYEPAEAVEIEQIFARGLKGEILAKAEIDKYKTALYVELAQSYKEKNWVMQFHMGTMRNNNQKKFATVGKDAGFDSINDHQLAENLSRILSRMNDGNNLPKTVLYTLNPKDNFVLGTMIGNFQEELRGKMQFGSAWWFNDHKDGMRQQLTDLANLGVLSTFIGMLTDSRSYLSFARHEYFRRILCQLIGEWVEEGEYPNDREFLGKVVEDISYNNAERYFTGNDLEVDPDQYL
ncbi:MAG: glucuronate isomerase [Spirochaetales bacterium]|nr:glucuronate isomerase [Spirochaetales bacterium]